jgi:hypothetical protein
VGGEGGVAEDEADSDWEGGVCFGGGGGGGGGGG